MTDDFTGLGLSDKVIQAVADAGYTKPTDIQAKAIPPVLERRDVIGIAQTGTGKTASFVLPMLTLLEKGRARARMPRTLILEPTRELAAQVHENFEKYGKNHKLTVALLIGGVSFDEQNKKLDRGADVLIATPGRLLDHFERGKLLMTGVEILVIDEADRMLDMGFIPDIERICGLLPPRRQTLFFSATMPPEVRKLTGRFLRDPVQLEVARQASTADTIVQRLLRCSGKPAEKRAALREQIREAKDLANAIVFCNRKRDVATLYRSLTRHGFNAGELHGDMDQKSRMETLDKFKTGKITLLVASDVAARGLDIPAVSHVFNFDVPSHAEDYVHRIGRTGRAGRSGASITLVTPADSKHLDAILKLIRKDVEWIDLGATPESESEQKSKPESAPDAGEGRKRPSRRSGAKAKPAGDAAPNRPQADGKRAAKKPPERVREAPSKGRRNEEPVEDASTPFGSDGHVPAFLLRPAPRSS
ncbi:MAG TPA: DEAD/DEAH box helicase [Devosiaceae bacterium]